MKSRKVTVHDHRRNLAQLERLTRDALKRSADLRAEIVRGPDAKRGRMLPKEGSRWTKHRAFLAEHETNRVWTYLFWCWGGQSQNDQLAVLETEIEGGKPYRRAVLMSTLVVEWVPTKASQSKGKRGSK